MALESLLGGGPAPNELTSDVLLNYSFLTSDYAAHTLFKIV